MPQIKDKKVVHPKLSYRLIGLCFGVHNKIGRHCNEQQYADALENILQKEEINYQREKFLPPSFEGEEKRNKPDFVVEGKIILELKAKRAITRKDYHQMRRYLAATRLRLGLIANFRSKFMSHKRVLNSDLPH